jgi:hypothetical protein
MNWWKCQCGEWIENGPAIEKHMKETGHTSMTGPAYKPQQGETP